MGVNIVNDELPINKHTVGECYNCKNTRYIRQVEIVSAFFGAKRGHYPLCFFCFGPRFFWKDNSLKDSRTWATPYYPEQYMVELEAAEHALHTDAAIATCPTCKNLYDGAYCLICGYAGPAAPVS